MYNSEDQQNELVLMANADDLRSERVLVDVVLIANGQRLNPCHKFMLAASSPYFRAMFSHGMMEQDKKEIEIQGVDRPSLEIIVQYIYTGRVSVTDDNAQGLLTACSLLQMSNLYSKCRDYMARRLDISNCISMYQFARFTCCIRLQNEAMRFITRRFEAVTNTSHWFNLSKDELIDIISSDDLWINSEEIVYEAALSWLVHDLENRSAFLAEVLSHVRFVLTSDDFLNNCILEEVAILDHPSLRIQIEAAKSYKISTQSTTSLVGTDSIDDDSEVNSHFPSYLLPVSGLEKAVKIPLNVKRRAGMDTKELLMLTNGRRTFVMNPNVRSEYYGCLESSGSEKPGDTDTALIGLCPQIPAMKNPEAHVSADGVVFLLGGLEIERSSPLNVRTKLYRLEVDGLEWKACASMPSPRCMAAYGDGCGHLYVMGGKLLADGDVVSNVMKYSINGNSWKESAPMPTAVYGHGAASYEGKIFVMGGKTGEKTLVGNMSCLDCSNDVWTTMEPLSTPRFLHGVTFDLERDRILVVGGSSEDGVLGSVEEFNFSDKKWKFGESFPGNRCAQYITEIGGEIHAIGGYITVRSEDKFESRELHDIFVMARNKNEWSRKIRRIRGTAATVPMARVKVRINTSNLTRASIAAGISSIN